MIKFISKTIDDSCSVVSAGLKPFFKNNKTDIEVEIQWGLPWDILGTEDSTVFQIGYTVHETPILPVKSKEQYIEMANSFDLLLLTSYEAANAFFQSGVDTPISVVPLGVNPEKFQYIKRDFKQSPFIFLHYGSLQFRKGTWLILEAWRDLHDKIDARLVLQDYIKRPEAKQLYQYYGDINNIIWDFNYHENIVDLLSNAHCLIYPSLAEGWGLPITESMATGLPVITNRTSAMLDYFKQEAGWFLSMDDKFLPISLLFEDTPGYLRLPNLDQLKQAMLEAYHNREETQAKGEWASKYIRSKFTWKHTFNHLMEKVNAMVQGNSEEEK